MLIEYSINDISIRSLWKSNHKLNSIHVNFFIDDYHLQMEGFATKKETYNTK